MFRRKIPLGRILGISIQVDYSWFLVFALLSWTLAVGYYPAEFTHWPTAEYWIVAAATVLLMFASVLLHELGHSMVALRNRVPVRSITLFIFGGVAQIGAEPPNAGAEFRIAVAGPLVSLVLAALFTLAQPLVAGTAWLLAVARYLAYINGALVLFNLIPGFPLDGGRVLRAILWGVTHDLRRATIIAGNVGRVIGFLLMGLGIVQVVAGNSLNGLWIAFMGWFLQGAAVAEIQQQVLQGLLAGHTVSEVMTSHYSAVPADAPLQDLVDHHLLDGGRRTYVVIRGHETAGLLTPQRLQRIPRAEWPTTTAAQAMIPIGQAKRIKPDAGLWAALEEMDRGGVSQLAVMSDGRLLGMVRRDDTIRFLRTLQAVRA
jgi:Zn-dependent protease